jgi:hypothetical protein
LVDVEGVFEVCAVVQSELLVGAGEVAFDGLHVDEQRCRDGCVAVVVGGECDDSQFGWGERLETRDLQPTWPGAAGEEPSSCDAGQSGDA